MLYVSMQESVFLLDVLEAFWHRYIYIYPQWKACVVYMLVSSTILPCVLIKGCHSLHMTSHWYLKVQMGECASEM